MNVDYWSGAAGFKVEILMNIEKISHWLTLGANFGVLVGIVFLIIEINQNTQQAELDSAALQTSNYQDIISGVIELNSYVIQDPDFAEILIKGETDPSALSPTELRRYNSYTIITMRHGDMAYYNYLQGTIDEQRLNNLLSIVAARLASGSLAMQIWEEFKRAGILDSGYAQHVERLVDNSNYGSFNRALGQ